MVELFVNLDDRAAEWLAAQIDDSKPTLRDVAQAALVEASRGLQERAGFKEHTGFGLCECGVLERLSREEASPVVFDPVLNEYRLLRQTPQGQAEHRIAYCFWCGGRAPPSRRDQLFAKVSYQEVERLNGLCAGIRTFEDAVARFGQPDFDRAVGTVAIAKMEDGAEEHRPRRVISYKGLSDVAEVRFTQRLGDLVSASFVGKYVAVSKSPVA